MTMHDDRELQERFERRLSGVDTEIPEPPPISALTGAGRVRVPARAGSASRGPIAVALVAVLAVAVVLLGAPLALRNGQQPAASDGVVQPTPMTAPSAGPTDLGPVDSALEELDLDGVVNGLAGGPGCTLDRPGGYGAGSATDAAGRLVSWHSNIVWVVTCPHAAGDTTLGFLLVDGLRAEIVRLGGTVTGESGWTDDAATAFVPYERSLVILGDATTGVARVMTFDAKLPELRIIVTVDLQLRDEAR